MELLKISTNIKKYFTVDEIANHSPKDGDVVFCKGNFVPQEHATVGSAGTLLIRNDPVEREDIFRTQGGT